MSARKIPEPTHLDVSRSLVVASPAGSGKTQKLAERYVALLKEGVEPERILAITFTEKAAAEMKERVLSILRKEFPEVYQRVRLKLSRFRISTVHAFARSVLERFSFDLGLPPDLEIIDAVQAELMREEVITEGLIQLGAEKTDTSLWVRHLTLTEGWTTLERKIRMLFTHIPQSYLALEVDLEDVSSPYKKSWDELKQAWGQDYWEALGFSGLPSPDKIREHLRETRFLLEKVSTYFLTTSGSLRKRLPSWASEREAFYERGKAFERYWKAFWRWHARVQTRGILKVFAHLAQIYQERKREEKVLDFGDLEYELYQVLYHSVNWSNVLASFDEQTDHILLDEFQDTNGLQWAIVTKLIEEWKAGMGAKQELGRIPTIFLVGDVRQSIYLFRGANVEVFNRAAEELERWMQAGFGEVVIRENFRSLPLIVEFVNSLFARLMKGGKNGWQTSYERFRPMRNPGEKGKVQILITKAGEKTRMKETKQAEAHTVAQKIADIVGDLPVYEKEDSGEIKHPCRYEDITLLLRRRTHLDAYEEALQRMNIPFVVVRGTGFHASAEVVLLRQLARFLSNPADDTALYGILTSPLCGLQESQVLHISFNQGSTLWERLLNAETEAAKKASGILRKLAEKVDTKPASRLFEDFLRERRLWSYFSGTQQVENIKKFIRLLEDFDSEGLSLFSIALRLERMSTREEEPKANVSTEGMDAVRLMTVHAAKGLDSPVVFLVGMEEPSRRSDLLAIREEEEKVVFTFTDRAYREHPERLLWEEKLSEEQKRLFYVACTRARDALFLSGVYPGKAKGWLSYLTQGLGMREVMGELEIPLAPEEVDLKMVEPEPFEPELVPEERGKEKPPLLLERSWPEDKTKFRTVTSREEQNYHISKGLAGFGEMIHVLLERISKRTLADQPEVIQEAVRSLVLSMDFPPSLVPDYQEKALLHLKALRDSGFLTKIIAPRKNADAEVPFVLREDKEVITGRIDRVLLHPDRVDVIDYKSFPSSQARIEDFAEQLGIYAKAAKKIYEKPEASCFLLFTEDAKLTEVKPDEA